MGVRLFGGVKIPTLTFGVAVPALGPALFASLEPSKHFIMYTVSTDVSVSQLETYLIETPTQNNYFDNGLDAQSTTTNVNVPVTQLETYLIETPTQNNYFDHGLDAQSTTTNVNVPVTQLETYLIETPSQNTIYNAVSITF